ncbi:MAG: hypothetical protein K8S24_05785 [Candidatus Aegiribacteria sp.]|nr:hypothetical protein [Candidatus Aegiribacteria sp.]
MPENTDLEKLVDGILLAQGNSFIKELLRKIKVKIGATKTDFLNNLNKAIDDGILTESILNEWLNEVEGWGNQHIYVYRVDNDVAEDRRWHDIESVRTRAVEAGLGDKWNVSPSQVFPAERKLVGIYCDETSFRLVWFEGRTSLLRDKDKDKLNKKIGFDIFDLHAFRHVAKRTVTRFDWPRGSRYAAILMQTPWNKKDHRSIKNEVIDKVSKFIDPKYLKPVNIGEAVRQLDQETVTPTDSGAGFVSEGARLESSGAYVDFGSTTEREYSSVAAVREVRFAVPIDQFKGERGIFVVRDNDNFTISRKDLIRFDLRGDLGWVKIRHMCSRTDIWNIVNRIAEMASNV